MDGWKLLEAEAFKALRRPDKVLTDKADRDYLHEEDDEQDAANESDATPHELDDGDPDIICVMEGVTSEVHEEADIATALASYQAVRGPLRQEKNKNGLPQERRRQG